MDVLIHGGMPVVVDRLPVPAQRDDAVVTLP
jgi:hypothetical protein